MTKTWIGLALLTLAPQAKADELFDRWANDKLPQALRGLQSSDQGYRSVSTGDWAETTNGATVSYKSFGETRVTGEWRFADSYLRDIQPPGGDPNMNTDGFGVNSRYRFVIAKGRGDEYLFKSVTLSGETPTPYDQRLFNTLSTRGQTPYQNAGQISVRLAAGRFELAELYKLPGFELTSATPKDGDRKLAVSFTYTPLDGKKAGRDASYCTIVYDLDQFGIPTEQSERCERHGTLIESRNTTGLRRKGKAVIQQRESKVTHTNGGKVIYAQAGSVRTETTPGPLPESEFTLSAFGLPEPVSVTWERPTPVWVWLLVAAGLTGGLGCLFGHFARRRDREVAT